MHEKEKIVQYSDLRPAEPVGNPEKIPESLLLKWWEEAKRICQSNSFSAVAFNQLSSSTLNRLGFDGMNPSIVYLGKNLSDNDEISEQLLINPEVQTSDAMGNSCIIEYCGSITDSEGKHPKMFVIRPKHINGEAYFWKPGDSKPVLKEFIPRKEFSSQIQHEVRHLNGETALSKPVQIVNFTDKDTLILLIEEFFEPERYNLSRIISQFDRWIIYEESKDNFKLIAPDGTVIKEKF